MLIRPLRAVSDRGARLIFSAIDGAFAVLLAPVVNEVLVRLWKGRVHPRSVLHISAMVHIPWYTTRILRRQGIRADYLAVGGRSPWWDKSDFYFDSQAPFRRIRQLLCFWRVVARYEVIHAHFGITLTTRPWELRLLRRLGRRLVVHYRGCEARDQRRNEALHPMMNICQQCDYHGAVCREGKRRVARNAPFQDLVLLTTPDLRDFMPQGIHFPFFCPEVDAERYSPIPRGEDEPFRLVHVTNHPGIEGTTRIEEAVRRLQARGRAIELRVLSAISPEAVLEAYRRADLTIGKMKMGYYANAQIESLFLGIPAVTYVRPELVTPEIEASGLILTDIDHIEETLDRILTHPQELEAKRRVARDSALRLHDNDRLGRELVRLYQGLLSGVAA